MTFRPETLGGTHVAEGAGSGTILPANSDPGPVRSDAVFLEVPVKIHGSRVVEIVREATPHTQPFEERTTAMIVFPEGGVVRMSTAVKLGQSLVLTNLKSGQDAIARVTKVRPVGTSQAYVEVVFIKNQAGFWGVRFSSEGPAPQAKPEPARPEMPPPTPPLFAPIVGARVADRPTSPPASSSNPSGPVPSKPKAASAYSRGMTSPNLREATDAFSSDPMPAYDQASAFVSMGASENVQPAADDTAGSRRSGFSGFQREKFLPKGISAGAPSAVVVPNEQVKADAQPAPLETASTPALTYSDSSSSAFGTRLAFGALADAPLRSPRRNWVLVAACVVLLLAAGGGAAALFVRRHLSAELPRISTPVAPAPPAEMAVNAGRALPVGAQPALQANSAETLSRPSPTLTEQGAAADKLQGSADHGALHSSEFSRARKTVDVSRAGPNIGAQEKAPALLPDMSKALQAHPMSSARDTEVAAIAPPSLHAGSTSATADNELAGIAGAPVILSRPRPASPEGPVSVGGLVKPPRIVSSVEPIYPAIARQAGVYGDVVVQIVIDKAGDVISAKAVSGPEMLRGAAVNALRQWKYAPVQLDGEPISVKMPVRIQFRR